MNIEIIKNNNQIIAVIDSEKILINNTPDALNIMGDCFSKEATRIILNERNIAPAFFDLKTGIAGDILQKFSTYNVRLAIVGVFSKFDSKSLKDFIYESNKLGRINFVETTEEALEKLGK